MAGRAAFRAPPLHAARKEDPVMRKEEDGKRVEKKGGEEKGGTQGLK